MPYVFLIVFGLVAFIPEWRRTALIIFFAASANILYAPFVDAVAALGDQRATMVHAFADFITILALLKWGSKGNLLQASILTAFIAVNFALLLDYKFPPYPVYEVYPQVIFALNIIQLFLISGGIYAVVRRLGDSSNQFLAGIRHGRHSGDIAGYRSRQHRNSLE